MRARCGGAPRTRPGAARANGAARRRPRASSPASGRGAVILRRVDAQPGSHQPGWYRETLKSRPSGTRLFCYLADPGADLGRINWGGTTGLSRPCWGGLFLFHIRYGRKGVSAVKLNGSRIVAQSLVEEGVKVIFGIARRHHHAFLRRTTRVPHPPRTGTPRAGRGPHGRRLRPRLPRRGRLLRHLRARRHQPGLGHRHRLPGLLARGRHHRQRPDLPDRQGCLPGVRHHRHHAARSPSTTTWWRGCRTCPR